MSGAVLAIAGADAAERTRRFTFILMIAAALYAGYLYVPDANAAYHTVVVHGHPGVYNSAFYGATIAALSGGFLTLFGFFLVRGAIERDVEYNVDGIVAASPVRKSLFVLSKWISSAGVLWAIAGVSYLAAMAMELLRSHGWQLDPFAYLMPYLLLTVPAMAVVAAVATAFDIVPLLRGVVGGVVFVILWPVMLATSGSTGANAVKPFDPLGFSVLSSSLIGAEQRAFPGSPDRDVSFGVLMNAHVGRPFLFSGIHWTSAVLVQRIGWLFFAVALVVLASVLFDLFRREHARAREKRFIDVARFIPSLSVLRIFRAEFGLIANGVDLWWYLGAIVIMVAGACVPVESVTKLVLPLALIWPLERISSLGARDRRFGVEEIVSSTAGFASRTLVAQWLAGVLLIVVLCSTCVLRFIVAGDPESIVACVAVGGAMSALALALGTAFGASRPFEALFLIAWYLGPVQHAPGFDFGTGMLTTPLWVTVVCVILSGAGLAVTRTRRTAG